MDEPMELTIAINILERKIAELNIQLSKDYNSELEEELKKFLQYREEIYEGNRSLVKEIINEYEND